MEVFSKWCSNNQELWFKSYMSFPGTMQKRAGFRWTWGRPRQSQGFWPREAPERSAGSQTSQCPTVWTDVTSLSSRKQTARRPCLSGMWIRSLWWRTCSTRRSWRAMSASSWSKLGPEGRDCVLIYWAVALRRPRLPLKQHPSRPPPHVLCQPLSQVSTPERKTSWFWYKCRIVTQQNDIFSNQ